MKVENLFRKTYNWKITPIAELNCALIDMSMVFTLQAGVDKVDGKEREFYVIKVYLKED